MDNLNSLSFCSKGEGIFIMGGGSIYRQFMPLADRLYITHIHMITGADTWFPQIDDKDWKAVEKAEGDPSENNGIPFTYVTYLRINKG